MSSVVLASRGRRDLTPWTLPYHVACLLWLYCKTETLLRFLTERVIGWIP